MAVMVIAIGVVVFAYITVMQIFTSEMSESDVSYQAHKAVERMTSDLVGNLEVVSATSSSIIFWYNDLNQNGTMDANETVSYSLNSTQEVLYRTQGNTSEAVAKYVLGFSLSYDDPMNPKIADITVTTGQNTTLSTVESSVKFRNL